MLNMLVHVYVVGTNVQLYMQVSYVCMYMCNTVVIVGLVVVIEGSTSSIVNTFILTI